MKVSLATSCARAFSAACLLVAVAAGCTGGGEVGTAADHGGSACVDSACAGTSGADASSGAGIGDPQTGGAGGAGIGGAAIGGAAIGGGAAGDTACSGDEGGADPTMDAGFMVTVESGQDLQSAVDSVLTAGGGTVLLQPGTWTLDKTLTLGSNLTLRGSGAQTIIQGPDALYNWPLVSIDTASSVENVTLADLVIDGRVPESSAFDTTSPYGNAFCLYFAAPPDLGKNLTLSGVEAHHCSESLHAKGFDGVTISDCYFHDSGVMLSPTLGNHDFYLFRDSNVLVSNVRANGSWAGDGLHLRRIAGTARVQNSTFVGNYRLGIHVQVDGSTTSDIVVTNCDLSYNGSSEHATESYSGLAMDGLSLETVTGRVTQNVAVGNNGRGIGLFQGMGTADANICVGNGKAQIASYNALTLGDNPSQGPFANGTYRIVSRRSNLALAPSSGLNSSLVQQPPRAVDAQKWTLTNLGNDEYSLKNVATGGSLDVAGGGAADGTSLVVAPPGAGASQVWRAIPAQEGSYRLCAKHAPGSCMQIDRASSCAGTAVVLRPYTARAHEQWLVQAL